MIASDTRTGAAVLGTFVDALNWANVLGRIISWAESRESRYVCICNVHSVVTASRDGEFQSVVSEADLVAPDGAPVAWMLRRLGFPGQERINGPDLMWRYCEDACCSGQPIYLFGGTAETLVGLTARLLAAFPGLRIAGAWSPPFRPLTDQEDAERVAQINASGARVVFVGLGCPKQELWMANHKGRVKAVMIGVGAAFDFHAGLVPRAPRWMQRLGLEWFHRLVSEPRRLWKRYLVTNSIFLCGATVQLVRHWLRGVRRIARNACDG